MVISIDKFVSRTVTKVCGNLRSSFLGRFVNSLSRLQAPFRTNQIFFTTKSFPSTFTHSKLFRSTYKARRHMYKILWQTLLEIAWRTDVYNISALKREKFYMFADSFPSFRLPRQNFSFLQLCSKNFK